MSARDAVEVGGEVDSDGACGEVSGLPMSSCGCSDPGTTIVRGSAIDTWEGKTGGVEMSDFCPLAYISVSGRTLTTLSRDAGSGIDGISSAFCGRVDVSR